MSLLLLVTGRSMANQAMLGSAATALPATGGAADHVSSVPPSLAPSLAILLGTILPWSPGISSSQSPHSPSLPFPFSSISSPGLSGSFVREAMPTWCSTLSHWFQTCWPILILIFLALKDLRRSLSASDVLGPRRLLIMGGRHDTTQHNTIRGQIVRLSSEAE